MKWKVVFSCLYSAISNIKLPFQVRMMVAFIVLLWLFFYSAMVRNLKARYENLRKSTKNGIFTYFYVFVCYRR